MTNFIIEKIIEVSHELQLVSADSYLVKYTKTAKDLTGKEVTVIDDQRTEQVTVAQLEAQKLNYQNAIIEIEKKLAEIAKL